MSYHIQLAIKDGKKKKDEIPLGINGSKQEVCQLK